MDILLTIIILAVLTIVVSILYYFDKDSKRNNKYIEQKIKRDEKRETIEQVKNTENVLVYSTKQNSSIPEKSAFALELEKAQQKREQAERERKEKQERQRKQDVQRSNSQAEKTRREHSDTGFLHNQIYETSSPTIEPSCSSSSSFNSSNSSDLSSSNYSSSDSGGSSSSFSCD